MGSYRFLSLFTPNLAPSHIIDNFLYILIPSFPSNATAPALFQCPIPLFLDNKKQLLNRLLLLLFLPSSCSEM
jgi:hypothetical protein